jgi:NAD(P)H dehydrogenase (quinone)
MASSAEARDAVTVAVTGASGHLGRKVADLLLERVDPSEVILLTRTPDALASYAERGFVVRYADFDDPAMLAEAFSGADRALLISALDFERRASQHGAAIEAAKAAGVRHVTYTSIPEPEGNPAAAAPSHLATEVAARESGLAWTFLRNSLYADFQVSVLEQAIASGQLVTSAGDGRVGYVARDDCAAAAAAVLTQDGHEGKAYDITGPEAIGPKDVAVLAAELGGRPTSGSGSGRRRRPRRGDARGRRAGGGGSNRAQLRGRGPRGLPRRRLERGRRAHEHGAHVAARRRHRRPRQVAGRAPRPVERQGT